MLDVFDTGPDHGENPLYGKNVAMVDDKPHVLIAPKTLLLLHRVHVIEFLRTMDFVYYYVSGEDPIDLLVIKFNMPNVNGLDLIKLLREYDLTIPIILVVDSDTEDFEILSQDYNFTVLRKYDPTKFIPTVTYLLEKKET